MNPSNQVNRGFTIVEIMLVVAIIGILVMIAVPKVVNAVTNARIRQAEADLNMIVAAINQLTMDTGKFPATAATPLSYDLRTNGAALNSEVLDLSTPDAGLMCCNPDRFGSLWRGPYLEKLPVDPWGQPYWLDPDYNVYSNRAQKLGQLSVSVVVGSYGPNRGTLNAYDSDDIFVILK